MNISSSGVSTTNVEPFKLKNSSDDFAQKLSNVFNGLDALEKRHEEWEVNRAQSGSKDRDDALLLKADPSEQDFRSRNEGPASFKKPQLPRKRHLPSPAAVPGYQKHPEKWTKYTLADVPGSDMSQAANAVAAQNFLNEMKDRTQLTAANDYDATISTTDEDDTLQPIVFGLRKEKPTYSVITPNPDSTVRKHPGNAFIMPECVVGMSAKPSKKRSNTIKDIKHTEGQDKSIHLDHLDEAEESDESDDDQMQTEADTTEASSSSHDVTTTSRVKTKSRALKESRCDDD